MFPEFSSLKDFLLWLAAPGALVAAGFFVAYVLERFAFWQKMAHDLKSAIVLALAVGISYFAKELSLNELIVGSEDLNQIFNLFVFYAANQFAYKEYFDINAK